MGVELLVMKKQICHAVIPASTAIKDDVGVAHTAPRDLAAGQPPFFKVIWGTEDK